MDNDDPFSDDNYKRTFGINLHGSIRVFFNKCFEVNRSPEMHKLKHWVKF